MSEISRSADATLAYLMLRTSLLLCRQEVKDIVDQPQVDFLCNVLIHLTFVAPPYVPTEFDVWDAMQSSKLYCLDQILLLRV